MFYQFIAMVIDNVIHMCIQLKVFPKSIRSKVFEILAFNNCVY